MCLVVMAVAQTAIFACQCGLIRSLPQASQASAIVVTGVVVGEHPSVVSRRKLQFEGDKSEWPALYPVTRLEIAVTRIFKGPADKKHLTLTHFGCCMCEQPLDVGKEYLLFVLPHSLIDGAYKVSSCDPNRQVAGSTEALAQIGPPSIVHERVSRRRHVGQWVRDAGDHAANVAVRAYLARTTSDAFIEDPLGGKLKSPWFEIVILSLGAIFLCALVVIARRRFRRDAG